MVKKPPKETKGVMISERKRPGIKTITQRPSKPPPKPTRVPKPAPKKGK